MKFAREFRESLEKEGYPAQWVQSAVPYGQLKKCIKKVRRELASLGLDPQTLSELVPQGSQEEDSGANRRGSNVGFNYAFEGKKSRSPKLTLFVQLNDDGVAVDAGLSPETRKFLENLTQRVRPDDTEVTSAGDRRESIEPTDIEMSPIKAPAMRQVEVPLTFDAEFFEILQGDVENLDKLQEEQQQTIFKEIETLSNDLTVLTRPSKYKKSDMYRWRELFETYLEAGVFFSTYEQDHGARNSATAARQLQWFQKEVMRKDLIRSFKLPSSHGALNRFIEINVTLLRNLKFQEINQKAISKILKKFDKSTKLGAMQTWPRLIESDPIMSNNMAKAVCAQVSTDLVKIVPQLDDYQCPVCCEVVWRPIRMKCNHIFCIGCTVKLQKEKKKFCPLCRNNVVLEADTDSIDPELSKFLQKYFPKEVRAKQIVHETADGRERFGPSYVHPSEGKGICMIM